MTAEKASTKSKSGWIGAGVHKDITLPSGYRVDIKLPNLAALVKSGQLPNELLQVSQKVAQASQAGDEIPDDLYDKMQTFNEFLVSRTIVKPEITDADVSDLPAEDVEMVVGFATRRLDFDAVGHHLAGLEAVDSFRTFRGLDAGFSDILGGAGGA